MQIPDESKINLQEVKIPGDLKTSFSDSVAITAKKDVVVLTFLQSEPLDPKQQKAVTRVYMTPESAKNFAESVLKMFKKEEK